jgi:hypothetical protein
MSDEEVGRARLLHDLDRFPRTASLKNFFAILGQSIAEPHPSCGRGLTLRTGLMSRWARLSRWVIAHARLRLGNASGLATTNSTNIVPCAPFSE